NGSSWITLWSTYFARQFLPGVRVIQVGNEAVQLNFMAAHRRGEPCPPQINIDLFVSYAEDLVRLHGMDALIITCSTMNRAAASVKEAMAKHRIPVVQIDEPMMEAAVERGGKILVVATHGPTVKNTQQLLRETAERKGIQVDFAGATIEDAFTYLGNGDIQAHNDAIAGAIRDACRKEPCDIAVLAQLSMSVFKLSYPNCERTFGMPVLTSGECGFQRIRDLLTGT
ncbi:hypothetical protein GF339_12525, partial [candidate division KSB3 bacterium]|nr:hypothetical protein [candidate division KSB3 bacterium]MBD3325407.1 hypothetical protein [candidate division KSB3 bacterium]